MGSPLRPGTAVNPFSPSSSFMDLLVFIVWSSICSLQYNSIMFIAAGQCQLRYEEVFQRSGTLKLMSSVLRRALGSRKPYWPDDSRCVAVLGCSKLKKKGWFRSGDLSHVLNSTLHFELPRLQSVIAMNKLKT